jgi:hypothetical protein
MIVATLWMALAVLGQADAPKAPQANSKKWTEFYTAEARKYTAQRGDDGTTFTLLDRPIFDWASLNDYNGALFAWTNKGRPVLVASIFSFPTAGSNRRLAVHEFASFADAELVVTAPSGKQWQAKASPPLQALPNAARPPDKPNQIKLHARRLAKEFSASMNRKGERWELRLLPTPLLEYQEMGDGILGGALFAFVGYTTDPEILLLLEARETKGKSAWHFQAVRFSDKSLFLKYKDEPVWESLRLGHGHEGANTDDPQYQVLHSERLSREATDRLKEP